jgi:hypothetical protein
MNTINAIIALFTQALMLGNKLAPSPELQADNHLIHRERLVEKEYQKRLTSSINYLRLHKRITVDTFVAIRFNDIMPEDREKFRAALKEVFKKR